MVSFTSIPITQSIDMQGRYPPSLASNVAFIAQRSLIANTIANVCGEKGWGIITKEHVSEGDVLNWHRGRSFYAMQTMPFSTHILITRSNVQNKKHASWARWINSASPGLYTTISSAYTRWPHVLLRRRTNYCSLMITDVDCIVVWVWDSTSDFFSAHAKS
jgi:hypothetical protein